MLLEAPVKAEFLVMILTMLLGMIELDLLDKTAIKDLLSKKSYNLFVKKFVESDAMRTNAIGRMLESDVYAELISDVLYNGIEATTKSYIQGNIKRTVSLSKAFLERDLDEQRIKSIANEIWKKPGRKKLATFVKPLDEETLEEFLCIGEHCR